MDKPSCETCRFGKTVTVCGDTYCECNLNNFLKTAECIMGVYSYYNPIIPLGPKEKIDSAIEEIKLLDTLVNVDRYSDSVYNSFRKEVCAGCSDPNCLRSKCEIYDCHKFENYFEI